MKTTISLIALAMCFLTPEALAGGHTEAINAILQPQPDGTSLKLTWSNCGTGALATITDMSPTTLQLGTTTSIGGTGKLTKDVTGGSWSMTMTGVGGISLMSGCSGDASTSKSCKIGVGPVSVGSATYGAVSFPVKAGDDVKLPNLVSIKLPSGLPSFATATTTTLNVKDSDGALVFCTQIKSAPMDTEEEYSQRAVASMPIKEVIMHQEDTQDHKCFEATSTQEFASKGITMKGPCPAKYNEVDSTKTVKQCPDGVTNVRYCNPISVTIATKGEAGTVPTTLQAQPDGTSLKLTWSNCGTGALATITDMSPTTLQLGTTTSIGGTGKLTKDVTGGSWSMTMTGVGGISLMSGCSGDASTSKSCKIGVGPVSVGSATYGAVSFPVKAGDDVKLPNLVSIKLPSGLPSFATATTTTLNVKDSDGALVFCTQIKSAPMDTEEEYSQRTFVMHQEDAQDHKCFEATSTQRFASKGITRRGPCPAKYNEVDSTKTVKQCPDGVTNVRYCNPISVTVATKGEAGEVAPMREVFAYNAVPEGGKLFSYEPEPFVGCLPAGKCCLDCRGDCCSNEWHTTLKCGGLHRCD